LTQITFISFDYNHISDVNSGSFSSNITGVTLTNNLLSSIPSIFKSTITELTIDSNIIKTIEGNKIPASVTSLDLSSNYISQLTVTSFPQNSSLVYLYLSSNPLSTISLDAFINLAVLTEIFFHNTKLTRVPLALVSLKSLSYLDISNCTSLVCTCQEQSLHSRISNLSVYDVNGDCGVTSVYRFFTELSPQCPPLL
jgi:Leucine-rich repeat (LRR) protein